MSHEELRASALPVWSQHFAEARAANVPLDTLVAIALDRSVTETADEELVREGFPVGSEIAVVGSLDRAKRLLERIGHADLGRILDGEALPVALTLVREPEGAITSVSWTIAFSEGSDTQ